MLSKINFYNYTLIGLIFAGIKFHELKNSQNLQDLFSQNFEDEPCSNISRGLNFANGIYCKNISEKMTEIKKKQQKR